MTRAEPSSAANRYREALGRSGASEPAPAKPPLRAKPPRVRVEPATDPWTGKKRRKTNALDLLERVELEAYRASERSNGR